MVTDTVLHNGQEYDLQEMVQVPPYPEVDLICVIHSLMESEYFRNHLDKSVWDSDGFITFLEGVVKDVEAEGKLDEYYGDYLREKGYIEDGK